MPEPDDATLDTLLSAAFIALSAPAPSPMLKARIREKVLAELETGPPLPMRIHIVEHRQGSTLTRIAYRTAPRREDSHKATPHTTERQVNTLRTTLVVSRKGNP